MPRWLDVGRVTFKYGLGDEFIDVLAHAAQARPRQHPAGDGARRRGVAARRRRRGAAQPGRARRPHARPHVRRLAGPRPRPRRPAARDLPLPGRRQRVDDARVRSPGRRVADGGAPGGRRGDDRHRRVEGRRRQGPGGVLAPTRSSSCSPSTARRTRSRSARHRSAEQARGRVDARGATTTTRWARSPYALRIACWTSHVRDWSSCSTSPASTPARRPSALRRERRRRARCARCASSTSCARSTRSLYAGGSTDVPEAARDGRGAVRSASARPSARTSSATTTARARADGDYSSSVVAGEGRGRANVWWSVDADDEGARADVRRRPDRAVHRPGARHPRRATSVPASFFMIGERCDRHPDDVRRAIEAGHEVANHTYDHYSAAKQSADELRRTDRAWRRRRRRTSSAQRPRWFRPVKGHVTGALLRAAADLGHDVAIWTLWTRSGRGEPDQLADDDVDRHPATT